MREKFSRRRLPHWDLPGATYFITTCLLDSIPAQGLVEIERFRISLERQSKPAGLSAEDWIARQWKQIFARQDDWLDRRPTVRHLEDSRLAEQVEKSLKHFVGDMATPWCRDWWSGRSSFDSRPLARLRCARDEHGGTSTLETCSTW